MNTLQAGIGAPHRAIKAQDAHHKVRHYIPTKNQTYPPRPIARLSDGRESTMRGGGNEKHR